MTDENKYWVLFELQDAHQALMQIINDLKIDDDDDDDETQHRINMAHLFHHFNSAWNMREVTLNEIGNDEKMEEWKSFPKDIEPL